jgi:hypothetical protein
MPGLEQLDEMNEQVYSIHRTVLIQPSTVLIVCPTKSKETNRTAMAARSTFSTPTVSSVIFASSFSVEKL